MSSSKKILVLAGDGIGPEVMREVAKIVNWFCTYKGLQVEVAEELVGGASLAVYGVPIRDEVIQLAQEVDAVLFGAVGDPAWAHVDFALRPEAAILALRQKLDLFANLRPAKVFHALADASTLKRDFVSGLDLLIIRETVGGIYFGEPRGIEILPDGTRRGVNTEVYTTREIERVARVAFDAARKRQGRVCSVEKSNVMESGLLWREAVTALHQAEYADIALTHMLADNCAMQLVRDPKQFDVIVTGNLFGDLLSDLASMLTGSLGMLPSATLGPLTHDGRRAALYEPIHGSAPDIAGQGIANPIAQILSFAMLLRYSFNRDADARLIETATENVLNSGLRTADIMTHETARVGTEVMGAAILQEIKQLSGQG